MAGAGRAATATGTCRECRRRNELVRRDLLLQQLQREIDLRCQRFGLGHDEMIERKAVASAALRQRGLHPGDRQIVLADARQAR